ncbi:MAG: hypothetical protein ACLQT7_00680 [Candidatus Dormibacteria bacterium]
MGVFFERQADPGLTQLLRTALTAEPPTDSEQQKTLSVQMAGQLQPVVSAVSRALASKPPTPAAADAQASSSAADLTNQLLGGTTFNTGRFLVALAIFVVLLGGGVTADALKLTNSYTTLFALSTTIFGVVVGFLGGEKS